VQEVHLVVQLHPIASGVAVDVSRSGSLLRQGGGHYVGGPPLGHKVVTRIVLDVLVVRLNLAGVHVAVQTLRLRLVAWLGAHLDQGHPGRLLWMCNMGSLLRRRQHLVLVARGLGIVGGRHQTGLNGLINILKDQESKNL